VQGYDFYYLYKNKNCKLQLGGSDQWGNIVTGTELIRRIDNGEAYAITTPLIKKADGTKFGKTEGGNVWLDKDRTTPYKFYQYWINSSDEDAKNYIRIFTLKSREEIEALEAAHELDPGQRKLQKALAEDITTRVHSRGELEKAIHASEILFGKQATDEINNIDEQTLLSVFEGVPKIEISKSDLESAGNPIDLVSEVTKNEIFPSKGEARRMIQGGGVSINKNKIENIEQIPAYKLLHGKYMLIQKGKKNYYLVEVK
jgi:tyrosyl-tRNA synthetase